MADGDPGHGDYTDKEDDMTDADPRHDHQENNCVQRRVLAQRRRVRTKVQLWITKNNNLYKGSVARALAAASVR